MKNYEFLPERNYVRQAPEIVNGRWSLTKQESNILLLLLGAIQKDDEDFKDYIFRIEDLEHRTKTKINSNQLRLTVKSLMSRVLEVPTEKGYKLFNWFSYFEYSEGIMTCSFDRRLKPYLLDLKQFVLADSRHLLDMKSEYSRRIYLLLKEYAKFGTRTFNVKELQDILQVPESYKERYNKFKEAVLLKAEADLNKFSDLEVKLSEKKLGRKVVEITYSIKKNDNDLKAFIETIRELYANEALYYNKEGRLLKCSEKGLLYYADDVFEWLDKKTAQKVWGWLHENRDKLLCFQQGLFDPI